jgi:hypothetical protein
VEGSGSGGLQECCNEGWDRKHLLFNRDAKVPTKCRFARIRSKQNQDGIYGGTELKILGKPGELLFTSQFALDVRHILITAEE